MSPIEIKYPKGATPLDPDERAGLIPTYITQQGELNTLERENILEALTWATKKRKPDIGTVTFCYELHRRMFNRVWKWAGKPRQTDKNIGVHWPQISIQLHELLKDLDHWIANNTYPW